MTAMVDADAAKIPAARRAGIVVGSVNASTVANGQSRCTVARVVASVQSATITSASGACSRSESRQAPREGIPFTDAMTTESEGSVTLREFIEVPPCLCERPHGVEEDDQRERHQCGTTMPPLRRHLPDDAIRHEERDERGPDDAERIACGAEPGTALVTVKAPMSRALACECSDAGRSALVDDEGRVVKKPAGAIEKRAVHDRFPEARAIGVSDRRERSHRVDGVVTWESAHCVRSNGRMSRA